MPSANRFLRAGKEVAQRDSKIYQSMLMRRKAHMGLKLEKRARYQYCITRMRDLIQLHLQHVMYTRTNNNGLRNTSVIGCSRA